MKYILGLILLVIVLNVNAMMLDADGNPRPMPYTIAELTQQCDINGYFVNGGTIYQCVKIREGVTKEELSAHAIAENKRLRARYEEFLKRIQDAKDHK